MSATALVLEHRPLARAIARDYYLPGHERQDVEQEALIALWVAAASFDPAHGMEFSSFAGFVIRRRLASAVRAARRQRHRMLNESVRRVVLDDGTEIDAIELAPGSPDPLEVLIGRERVAAIVAAAGRLTPLERRALAHVANGGYYRGDKQTDNAVDRARRKLRAAA